MGKEREKERERERGEVGRHEDFLNKINIKRKRETEKRIFSNTEILMNRRVIFDVGVGSELILIVIIVFWHSHNTGYKNIIVIVWWNQYVSYFYFLGNDAS